MTADRKVVSFARVAHVGTYPAAPSAARRSPSLEGIGLSVSVHPEVWIRIARLGGLPVRTLARSDGQNGRFRDGHAAQPEIVAWGARTGNAAQVPSYTVTWSDDEMDQDVSMTFLQRRSAEAEAADRGVDVVVGSTVREAGALERRLVTTFGRTNADQVHRAFEGEIANRFVAATRPDLDGVWWTDRLDVPALSAPRGSIVPGALGRWRVTTEPWQRR